MTKEREFVAFFRKMLLPKLIETTNEGYHYTQLVNFVKYF